MLRRLSIVLGCVLLTISGARAQDTARTDVENPDLRQELLEMMAADQEARAFMTEKPPDEFTRDDIETLQETDRRNRNRLKEIVEEHGWPSSDMVGRRGLDAAFILVQHADQDPAFQRQMLPFVRVAYHDGDMTGEHVALLTDRVLRNEGRPQLYGTQVDISSGEIVVMPVDDPDSLDARRARMGLPPMEEYLRVIRDVYGIQDE